MNSAYDARLDKTASTPAAIKLLASYHLLWNDWRVVNMAYNTGASRMRRIIKSHGMPAATPVIPDLPVSATTRNHLTRLLAIACVIRQPQRFHVSLPALSPEDRLITITLPAPARLREVAQVAGISLKKLRELNAGYRHGRMTASTPTDVLLPAFAAHPLHVAMASGWTPGQPGQATAVPDTYTVVSGDSLWTIAKRYGIELSKLLRWNDLQRDSLLQPGQELRLVAPSSVASSPTRAPAMR